MGPVSAPVGIDKIRVCPGTMALDMGELVTARDANPTEIIDQMLITERSVNPPWEDPVTMAVSAAEDLLRDTDKSNIRLLLVGSESGLDQEKALSTWIQGHLGLSDECRNLEVKHACYAGAGAVNLACSWVLAQPDKSAQALVITCDHSRQHFHKPYEFVMGAGACALLISRNPGFLELEIDLSGFHTHEISDLTRPTSRVEAGHSETSLLSYLQSVDITFDRYVAAVQRRGIPLTNYDAYRAWLPHQVYHAPFGGITARAHKAVARNFGRDATRGAAEDFRQRVQPGLQYNRRMGGTYASSIFISLLGVVDALGDADPVGQRVGIYAYGSGSSAEFYSGRFGPQASAEAHRAAVGHKLDQRRKISVREYEEAERERSAFIDCDTYKCSFDGPAGLMETHYGGKNKLIFKGVRDWVREYGRT